MQLLLTMIRAVPACFEFQGFCICVKICQAASCNTHICSHDNTTEHFACSCGKHDVWYSLEKAKRWSLLVLVLFTFGFLTLEY